MYMYIYVYMYICIHDPLLLIFGGPITCKSHYLTQTRDLLPVKYSSTCLYIHGPLPSTCIYIYLEKLSRVRLHVLSMLHSLLCINKKLNTSEIHLHVFLLDPLPCIYMYFEGLNQGLLPVINASSTTCTSHKQDRLIAGET